MPRLAHVRLGLPLQEDLLQLVERQEPRSASSAIRASRPDSRRCARKPASAASAISASSSTTLTGSKQAASVPETRRICTKSSLKLFLRPDRSEGDRAGARRRHPGELAGGGTAIAGLEDGDGVEGRVPACIPSTAHLPMVWYVPPLSPITAAAEAGKMGVDGGMPDVKLSADSTQVSRQPADGRRDERLCSRRV